MRTGQITQLDPPIPVFIPEKNQSGLAYGWLDYGPDYHLFWIVGLQDTTVWTLANPKVRMVRNETLGREPGNNESAGCDEKTKAETAPADSPTELCAECRRGFRGGCFTEEGISCFDGVLRSREQRETTT